MEKRILIPTDFSENSWNSLTYAVTLYRDVSCTFFLLNAFQLYHFSTDSIIEPQPGEKAYEKAKEKSENGLEKILEDVSIRGENPNHKFEMISTYNSVIEAVKQTVPNKEIDLIIMGTRGESNAMNIAYGSNAINVINKTQTCPILVIPENTKLVEDSVKEIVFATNFNFFYKRRELNPVFDIATRFKSEIRVLYVEENKRDFTEEQQTNKQVLENLLSDYVCTFHTLTQVKVAKGIHTFIESRGSSLLILYQRKKGFFWKLFPSSLIDELGFNPQVPILVLKEID